MLLLGPIAWWVGGTTVSQIQVPAERAAAINAVRQTVLVAAAGTATILGLAVSFRTYLSGRRAQFSGRYATCVGLVASDRLDERIGGIFAFEHLMRESTAEHAAVVAVLVAFIRRRAARGEDANPPSRLPFDPPAPPTQPADVQSALLVLARRPAQPEQVPVDLSRLDLRGAVLSAAGLDGACLSATLLDDADLTAARLRGADLTGASLAGASLAGADLRGANLAGTDSTRADFTAADLTGSVLREARLRYAIFVHAKVVGVDLAGLDLTETDLADGLNDGR
ncbi:MAG TPA: pentapeptide repeat-containing protein [Mycobacteriales bacterium]|nr:pentapeptide repeat-containing protein [Mycobacteriales bacterium]